MHCQIRWNIKSLQSSLGLPYGLLLCSLLVAKLLTKSLRMWPDTMWRKLVALHNLILSVNPLHCHVHFCRWAVFSLVCSDLFETIITTLWTVRSEDQMMDWSEFPHVSLHIMGWISLHAAVI